MAPRRSATSEEPDFRTSQERSLWRFFRKALEDMILERQIELAGGSAHRLRDLGQTDVSVTFQDIRLVFECKSWKGDRPPASLPDDILKFSNSIANANRRSNIKTHGILYTDKPIGLSARDACTNGGIRWWTHEQRDTVGKRFLSIVNRNDAKDRGLSTSRLNEVGWLDFIKDVFSWDHRWSNQPIRFEALRLRRFGKTLITFAVDGETLLKIAHVPRVTDLHGDGAPPIERFYQRFLDGRRLLEIAEGIYDEALEVNFPNNIICSAEDPRVFDSKGKTYVEFQDTFGALRVIDGQHRLFASALLPLERRKSFKYIVTTLANAAPQEEARLFAAINRKQKGVDPDLVDYLLSNLSGTDAATIAPKVILELASPHRSLFTVRVKNGFTRGGTLRLHQLVSSLLERRFITDDGGLLQRRAGDFEQPLRFLTSFFQTIKHSCPAAWEQSDSGFLQRSIGVLVFLEVLSALAERHGQRPRHSTDQLLRSTEKCLPRLAGFRFPAKWNKETRRELRGKNVRAILKRLRIGAEYFLERPTSS